MFLKCLLTFYSEFSRMCFTIQLSRFVVFLQQLTYLIISFDACQQLFLKSFLDFKRRKRDSNPCAAINDLLTFQASPFSQTWVFLHCLIYIRYSIAVQRLQRRGWDSNPRALADKRFSRPPRYDHFDTSPFLCFRVSRLQEEIYHYTEFMSTVFLKFFIFFCFL